MSMQFRDLKRQYEHIKGAVDSSIQSVIDCAAFISGSPVKNLEITLASYTGSKHCINCGNGTDAITIALRALLDDIPREQWKDRAVFVPDFTFFSTGECPAELGLPVYFVDVRRDTYNMDPEALQDTIERVIKEKQHKPSVVIAVDLFGQPAEYDKLRVICDKYDMKLIEDAAQGFGGRINDKLACSFGDISTTSFFPAKPLGCYGDGGAIFTDDDRYADLIRSIAVHGKDTSNLSDPMSKYNNVRIGYNSRLDTIQAGVLNAKFPVFRDEELSSVNRVAEKYNSLLSDTSLGLPKILDGCYSSWAQYTVQLPEDVDRDAVQEKLKTDGIPTMVYYKKPMHKQEAFRNTVGENCLCPVTEELCERVLCLPIHPYLEQSEVEMVCGKLKRVL